MMGIVGSKSTRKNDISSMLLSNLGNGKLPVGYAEIMINDGENDDIGILATIYYPSITSSSSNDISEYPKWMPRHEYISGLADYRNISPHWFQLLCRLFIGEKRIAARWHAELNGADAHYPVVIFSHGLSACRNFHSVYCSSLASYGYVVASVEHRDCTACWTYSLKIDESTGEKVEVPIKIRKLMPNDNKFQLRNGQLHKRVAECVKTLHVLEELNMGLYSSDQQINKKLLLGNDFAWSQFKSRLDMNKVFIAGHSFGGATAIAAAAFSTDFSAVVVLDGWMFPIERESLTRVQQPVLFMNAESFQWEKNVKDMLKVMENSKRSVLLTFNEATHFSFTDLSVLIPGIICRLLGIYGTRNPVRCAKSMIELTAHFLKSYYDNLNVTTFDLLGYEDIVMNGTKFAPQVSVASK